MSKFDRLDPADDPDLGDALAPETPCCPYCGEPLGVWGCEVASDYCSPFCHVQAALDSDEDEQETDET